MGILVPGVGVITGYAGKLSGMPSVVGGASFFPGAGAKSMVYGGVFAVGLAFGDYIGSWRNKRKKRGKK